MYILAASSRMYFVIAGFQASASSQRSEKRSTKRTTSSCEYTNCQSIKSLPKEMCVLFIHKNLPLMVYVWMHKYWKLNNRSAKKTQCFGQTTPLRESCVAIRDVATVLHWMYATKPYVILSLIKCVYCTKQCY